MSHFSEDDLTRDAFLGGGLTLLQPRRGYRAGVDPVFLAAAVQARAGQSVLELGCGAGQALLCLGHRVPGLSLTGVELQDAYADLARRNASENKIDLEVHQADLSALPVALRQRQFDIVIANPPYYRDGEHTSAQDGGRRVALGERTPLEDWVSVASKRLAPKGYLYMIQRADRLMDLLAACHERLGSVEVLPLAPRMERQAALVILRARKEGRAPFCLHAPLILHKGDRHLRDEEDYCDAVSQVLRCGAALPWP